MKYLFLLTISPVQVFIEQARKTQDLKAGSQILSDLIDYAINQLPSDTELIFPEKSIASKPNRFIAIVNTAENMQSFGDDLKSKIQTYFLEQAKMLLTKTSFFEECKDQLEDFFKIYWVAKKYDETTDYELQHKRLEELLGAVKANRPFTQLMERGRKCSINGEMNVKFYRKTSDETKQKKQVKGDKEKIFHSDVYVVNYKDYSKIEQDELQAGEGLCAISFLKRKWKIVENSFPSVAEIALLNEIRNFDDQKKQCFDEYKSIFKENEFISTCIKQFGNEGFERILLTNNTDLNTHFDYQMLYYESANEKNFPYEPQRLFADKYIKILNVKSKYYAILVFDADSMGKALQGKDKDYQKALSKCLGDFAKKATAYIDGRLENEAPKGKTVYAGGDDFLGFINLDYLFEAMQWLRVNFDQAINQEMLVLGYTSPALSFSAGIAIAHYKTPLSEVLHWARVSEKLAKKKYKENGKNAFCIAVLKHSGEIHQTTWKWSYNTSISLISTLNIISTLLNKLVSEDLSSKFIKNLDIEFRKLLNEKEEIIWSNKAMLKFELERLLLRAKSSDFDKKDAKQLAADIFGLFDADNTLNMSNFIQLLEIVDFLHRHVNFTEQSKIALTL